MPWTPSRESVGVSAIRATPPAFVRTLCVSVPAPVSSRSSRTLGTAAPEAATTRALSVVRRRTGSDVAFAGRLVSRRYGPA